MHILFITYPNPMPVSGSANPNEPPAPGQPKALSDEPNTNVDVGLPKPSEYDVGTCNTLSRNLPVGGTAGPASASRTPAAQPQLSIAGGGAAVEFRDRPSGTRAVARGDLDSSQFVTVEGVSLLDSSSDREGSRGQARRVEQCGGKEWWHRVEMQHHLAPWRTRAGVPRGCGRPRPEARCRSPSRVALRSPRRSIGLACVACGSTWRMSSDSYQPRVTAW